MALFGKKAARPMPPLAAWEYRCGDGRHWGFHYRVTPREGGTLLQYSRVMPEQIESIPASAELWDGLLALAQQYDIMSWEGFDTCRPRTGRTKRWLLYLTFTDGTTLRAEGCGAAPHGHQEMEEAMLALLNGCIDI